MLGLKFHAFPDIYLQLSILPSQYLFKSWTHALANFSKSSSTFLWFCCGSLISTALWHISCSGNLALLCYSSIWIEQMCRYSIKSKPCCCWKLLHTWWAGNDFLLTNKPYLKTVFKHYTDVLVLIKQSTHLIRYLAFWLMLSTLQHDDSWNACKKRAIANPVE